MSIHAAPYRLDWDIAGTPAGTGIDAAPLSQRPSWWPDWVRYPIPAVSRTPVLQLQARQLRDWTQMSARGLATLLGTTHPTVAALLSGEATDLVRRPDVRERIKNTHALCERVVPLLEGTQLSLMDVLSTATVDGESIVGAAARGAVASAYLAALRRISGEPDEEEGFPTTVFPAVPGSATRALHG